MVEDILERVNDYPAFEANELNKSYEGPRPFYRDLLSSLDQCNIVKKTLLSFKQPNFQALNP
jgi:hypothetical protein